MLHKCDIYERVKVIPSRITKFPIFISTCITYVTLLDITEEMKMNYRQCPERKFWILGIFATVVIIGIYFLNFRSFGLLSDILSFEQRSSVWVFQDSEERDFPAEDTDTQRIPHIIHHYYSTEYVPEKYVPYMTTFTHMNPSWEYRFWSFQSGRKLIEKHHPYLLHKYDCLGKTVQNSNMLRYVVLYQYGGVYTDLDVEALRPLDKVTKKYSCIFPPEPFEHAVLSYKMEYVVQTATVICRPSHPFLKFILQSMQHVSCTAPTKYNTGPGFITKQFMLFHNLTTADVKSGQYVHESNSPHFYRGKVKEDDINAVYVPNTQYFSDNVASKVTRKLPYVCKFYYIQSHSIKRACNEYYSRIQLRREKTYAYLYHAWFNSYDWFNQRHFKEMKTVHILDIIPDSILYRG